MERNEAYLIISPPMCKKIFLNSKFYLLKTFIFLINVITLISKVNL